MRERDAETTGVTRKSRLSRVKFAGCLSPLTHSHPPDRPSLVPPPSHPSLPSPVPHYPRRFSFFFLLFYEPLRIGKRGCSPIGPTRTRRRCSV